MITQQAAFAQKEESDVTIAVFIVRDYELLLPSKPRAKVKYFLNKLYIG